MAIVRPFSALRPTSEYAENVISLPYDVMNRAEASKMALGNPYSFLHICRSEIDLQNDVDSYSDEVYLKAKANIADFISKGVFTRDPKPQFYIYAQEMAGRVQTGLVATASIDEYLNNTIKKHEFTRYEKELDRIHHFDVCNANTEPVFLTYRDDAAIRAVLNGWISKYRPELDIVSVDGIRHILWPITDDDIIAKLALLFEKVDALYIADGHHRSASAVKVGLKRREEFPDYTGDEEFNYFMAVLFPDKDLRIFDYNRVIKDLNGLSVSEFLAAVSAKFTIEEIGTEIYTPSKKHEFGMYLTDRWYRLSLIPTAVDESDIIKSLDVTILQDCVLAPILGIGDPRKDKRIDFVGGIRGLKELEKRVHEDMAVAFALYPVAIEDLLSVSDQGMVMPPKSTWFEPKLGSGLFIHEL